MITIRDLHKSFGSSEVLRGVNLEIPKGKITMIIGRSGEGKSVFLKHLIGILRPDSGEILIDGQSLTQAKAVELNELRKRFGMLFQNGALFDSMTVYENISFPLIEHTDKSEDEIKKRVTELVDLVGLRANVIQKYPSELSGGMRKRVGLARAIALEPEILLYDEPTTGLDPVMCDVINHLILNTQKALKMTCVVISHDVNAVFAIADKIAMLHQGQILMEGPPQDFRNPENQVVKNFLEGKASARQLLEL